MFELKTSNCRTFRDVLTAASVIVDEATFRLFPEKMSLRMLNSSKVAMVELELPKTAFDEYQCDVESKMCVGLNQLLKLLRHVEANENLELIFEGERLRITVSGKYKRSFTLPTFEPLEDDPPTIKTEYFAKAKMESVGLRQIIEDSGLVGDTITIDVGNDKIMFETAGDISSVTAECGIGSGFLISLDVTSPAKATFNLDILTNVVKAASIVSEVVSLELTENSPLKLDFQLQQGGKMTFYFAPRINY